MAVHLSWTLLAQKDLKEVVAYIRRQNPSAAKSFSKSLIEQAELVADFSELGRVLPERNDPKIREIIYRSYRIIYRNVPSKNVVEILRVWHAARGEPEFEN